MSSRVDYVVLENLLLLVLIVAPGFESMGKRGAFVHEVFVTGYPEDTICGENLAKILTKPTGRDSDILQAAADLVNQLWDFQGHVYLKESSLSALPPVLFVRIQDDLALYDPAGCSIPLQSCHYLG